jgi:hypothetical protein|tara:strand:+ start:152 stop:526 length:375 start_codon:yes stop_codon:yes gene_type:complete
MARNESQFWQYVKRNTPKIKWTRIENTSSLGTPDLLGYNANNCFFTVELKVVKSGNKIRFSPHQISFHVRHPSNTFILVDDPTRARVCLYVGNQISDLVENGLKIKPKSENFEDCKTIFDHLIL